MNEATKQAYLDKTNAQLREWGARVDVIKAMVAKETAGARIDMHRQLESWQQKESLFKVKLDELKSASSDGYEVVKAGAQSVWNELGQIITSLESGKNETK